MSKIRRPDLEAIPVSFPEFAAARIFPWLPKKQDSGTLYYQSLKDDVDAQTGRNTAALGDISYNVMAATKGTFICSEVRAREKMSYDQVAGYGDQTGADIALGRRAKRAFFRKIEKMVASQLLDVANPIDVKADPVLGIDTQVANLQDLAAGDVVLVISNRNFVRLKGNATLKDRMKNTGITLGSGGDARYITAQQMAAAFGVKEVIIVRDKEWYAMQDPVDRGNAALLVLPNEAVEPVDEPQLGRLIHFEWDGEAGKFVMESYHDDDKDADVVDTKGQICLKVMNSELCKIVQLFDTSSESSYSSSSSSASSESSSSSSN